MTDAEKRLQFTPTEEQAYAALQQLINGEHSLHVPPLPEDADIVIGNVIREWEAADQTIAEKDKTVTDMSGQIYRLNQILTEKSAEIEQLKEMWNIAYGYGVRVEVEAVTGEIWRHYIERNDLA
ncbi:hypothetical protein [Alicyclobacillus dauci]|uniref:Uncharacterized protein n=1 Tax=Alicyclobacillus dauci TaxID=1475485 RepID=A0ABY6Z936_9BACL|nr:hypothetical protein [Alicyclobacillus dauci]WAH38600.1 hypothetical protein NZD86_09010 [Alicyclobacillus dauci]